MTRPVPSIPARPGDAAPDDAPAAHAGDAASFLRAGGERRAGESRRVLLGFGVLVVLGALALNAGLWHSARERFERDGWARLEASADMRRDQIAYGAEVFCRDARHLADDLLASRLVTGLVDGTLPEADRAKLENEIDRARVQFEFENVQIVDATGTLRYESSPTTAEEDPVVRSVVDRVTAAGRDVLGDPLGDEFLLGIPIRSGSGPVRAVLVVHTIGNRLFAPALARWPGLGDGSGAFLARADRGQALVLTTFASPGQPPAGTRVPLRSRDQLAVTMAATGIESRIETIGAEGRPAWAVTRALPDLGWGLVALASRDDVLAGMLDTTRGLLLLDLAIAIGLFAIAVVWRRLYLNALTRQAMDLTESHARRVQAIFDNAFDAIFTFDRSGRLRTVNRAAAHLFGHSPDEMDGQPVTRYVDWGSESAALPQPGTVGIGQAVRGNGEHVTVEYSLGSTGSSDEPLYTAIVRDVSDRIEAEQRIRAFAEGLEASNRELEEVNAQLEEASRLKSEFLANTSHELRTPLNGMIGFLQLVLDGLCDTPEEEREFTAQALQCSRHLLGLINDVLDIAKIEAGKFALEIEAIDVQKLFDEVQTVTHVQAAQKGLALEFVADVEDGVAARGDFGKVKQVLINLVGNSLKFTHEGRVRVRAVSRRELSHLRFEVEDTGIGIPPARQKVIFEKFVQGDGSTTRRYGGTGLGLAISRSLIEMMGGIIGVQSEGEGRGTRMHFSLPMWQAGAEVPAAEPVESGEEPCIEGPEAGPLVLVVEDDRVFRRFLTAVLQHRGYRTVEAGTADEGWAFLVKRRPACVVLDYALSSSGGAQLRTGWDLGQRMTNDPVTRHVPIVFVTGFDGELHEKLHATAFGRHPAHLVKPIEADDLIARIEALIGPVVGRPVRVLMADDDPAVGTFVRKVLPADRYHLHVTTDGEQCLHTMRTSAERFDVLLLDLMMPGVSGYDVLREMTLGGVRPELPVLVLTNFPEARNADERRLLERGLIVDVVPKTAVHADPAMLATLIAHCVRVAEHGPETAGDADDLREAA